jgi:hypothetical protein
MKIQRATFLGVRGVGDATLDLTDARTGAPHGTVVITGPGASGKTRVLEALIAAKEAIGAYGLPPAGASWIGGASAAKILITFHLDGAERDYAGAASSTMDAEVIFVGERARSEAGEGLRALLERYSHDAGKGKLEYFPANRRIPPHAPFSGLGTAEQRMGRAAKDPRKYSFVVSLLRALDHDRARREGFAARLEALSPTCRYVPGATDVVPRCFSSRGATAVTAADLSDGEADAVLFAATAVALGLDHSIVFVDRPDLHLDDAAHLLGGLGALGQDNQLFLAAGPALAAAAAAAGGAHVVSLKGA